MTLPKRAPGTVVFVGSVLVMAGALAPLAAQEGALTIEPLTPTIPGDASPIPWVVPGDTSWRDGKALFETTDPGHPDESSQGWMAVTSERVLVHVVVHHAAHLSSGGGEALWSGDSIQFGIDPLGRGAPQPELIDVEARIEKLYGTSPAESQAKAIKQTRDEVAQYNQRITDGVRFAMQAEDQDFCVGTVGANATPSVFCYYSGRGRTGEVKDTEATVVRDEAAKTTTYDVAIPWTGFGVSPGLSPLMKVSFQINNTIGALTKQRRQYWGGGVGGRFAPWKFKTLVLGEPPAGTRFVSLSPIKSTVTSSDDYVEFLAAACGSGGTLSARLGEAKQSVPILDKPTLQRFSIRAYPGELRGSTSVDAAVTKADGQVAAQSAFRLFSDSTSSWYAFAPTNDVGPSVLGMADWMDAPAGQHGFVQIKGKDLVCEDGTPIKFWGVGTRSYQPGLAPDEGTAKAFAAWYQKWGVNCVRNGVLFGEGWTGIGDANDTTRLDPGLLKRFDFSFNALKEKGIYYNLCAFWMEKLRPADKSKVLAYDEAKDHASELDTFAEDIQDLRIAAIVNFLKHKNPYTGLTYAEDAALACLEIRNEQDVYWYPVASAVEHCPTYFAKVRKQFCDWLRQRYGTQEKLIAAWGPRCIGTMMDCSKDESLDHDTLSPMFNAWFFSPVGLADQEAHLGARRRLLDTAEFLFEIQNAYFKRFTDAIRATGYKGLIVGSNWQADSGVGHLYNLLSDRLVGRIDRHNYFGGSGQQGMGVEVPEDDSSMLWQPGRALLSSGLQQLADRPFALSEWMQQAPNEWEAEGSPVIGFYGFGLQGWDAAFAGNNTEAKFDATYGTWLHVQAPNNLGLYPAIARSIYRGDVKEGGIIAARRVNMADLHQGKLDFVDRVAQQGDQKSVTSTVPVEALAAGRVVIELMDRSTPSTLPDLAAAMTEKTIVSDTGQLAWHYPSHDESWFTVDTDGTKGLVGFAPKRTFTLGDVGMEVDNRHVVLLVTALDRGKTLKDTRSALITALARERNTGMTFDARRSLTAVGGPPILLEPIFGSVVFGRKFSHVFLLDHDGRRTERPATTDGSTVTIDGTKDKTMYYEVVFE